ALRRGYNKRIETFPLAIALCTSTREVAACVRFARRRNLPIAVRSGGHSMEGFSSNNGGLVLNLSQLNHIALRDANCVRTGPGSTLSQLNYVLLPQGRLLPAGSCGSVGIGGLSLGGGYGFFRRRCDGWRRGGAVRWTSAGGRSAATTVSSAARTAAPAITCARRSWSMATAKSVRRAMIRVCCGPCAVAAPAISASSPI